MFHFPHRLWFAPSKLHGPAKDFVWSIAGAGVGVDAKGQKQHL